MTLRLPRQLIVTRGTPAETLADAQRVLGEYVASALWVGDCPDGLQSQRVSFPGLQRELGRSYDAVVLDFHVRIDSNAIGQAHGLVRGGGALVLRLPPADRAPTPDPRLRMEGWTDVDIGTRMARRLQERLREFERGPGRVTELPTPDSRRQPPTSQRESPPVTMVAGAEGAQEGESPATGRGEPPRVSPWVPSSGTPEQAQVVEALVRAMTSGTGHVALVAERGRGKSAGLGLALKRVCARAPELDIVVTAADARALAEVERFCEQPLPYEAPVRLLARATTPDVVVVDEAAQVSVPLLRECVRRHPGTRFVFATTTHGYEGTGRGFALRFLPWLRQHAGGALLRLNLDEPIRWAQHDPLEAFVYDLLILDAALPQFASTSVRRKTDALTVERVDRDALARDEHTLRAAFGLLVHAHYRTTPNDLLWLLDGPNMSLWLARLDGEVVGVNLIAREGALPRKRVAELAQGIGSIRGHTLPEAMVSHMGIPEAAELRMVRSVRIATHPELRLGGIARALTEAIHDAHNPDLFGTIFGATPGLLRFRRRVGYDPVRLSASRGSRTGEPAVMMVRGASERGHALVTRLRREYAYDVHSTLEAIRHRDGLWVGDELERSLLDGVDARARRSEADHQKVIRDFAFGPRVYESSAGEVARLLRSTDDWRAHVSNAEARLLEARVLENTTWAEAAQRAGFDTVRPAMRALRRAVRRIVEAAS